MGQTRENADRKDSFESNLVGFGGLWWEVVEISRFFFADAAEKAVIGSPDPDPSSLGCTRPRIFFGPSWRSIIFDRKKSSLAV